MQDSWVRNAGQTRYKNGLLLKETLHERREENRTITYQKAENGAKIIVDLGRGDYDIKKARKLVNTVNVTNVTDNTESEELSVTHDKLCVTCGKTFTSVRNDAKFCSATCRVKASRK